MRVLVPESTRQYLLSGHTLGILECAFEASRTVTAAFRDGRDRRRALDLTAPLLADAGHTLRGTKIGSTLSRSNANAGSQPYTAIYPYPVTLSLPYRQPSPVRKCTFELGRVARRR